MIIKALVENKAVSDDLKCAHGLSLYLETKNHKLLFDLGPKNFFVENAKILGIDLSAVDTVVISHGHFDHGGGLEAFLRINSQAKIYVHKNAFDGHYEKRPNGEKFYIGLNRDLLPNDRFIFVDDSLVIDEELELFAGVRGDKFVPSGNRDLLMEDNSQFVRDDFRHEQNLLVTENGKRLLLAGCAHTGIVNIIEHLSRLKGELPHYVIGGFHLYNPPADKDEDPEVVKAIGQYLKETGFTYYTCHCTRTGPYNILKDVMQEQIQYLATGSELII